MSEKTLVGSLIIGQSGGPSSVINCSAYGVIKTGLENLRCPSYHCPGVCGQSQSFALHQNRNNGCSHILPLQAKRLSNRTVLPIDRSLQWHSCPKVLPELPKNSRDNSHSICCHHQQVPGVINFVSCPLPLFLRIPSRTVPRFGRPQAQVHQSMEYVSPARRLQCPAP